MESPGARLGSGEVSLGNSPGANSVFGCQYEGHNASGWWPVVCLAFDICQKAGTSV